MYRARMRPDRQNQKHDQDHADDSPTRKTPPASRERMWLSVSQLISSFSSVMFPQQFTTTYVTFNLRQPPQQPVSDSDKQSSWTRLWVQFAQQTTIHGVHFIYANRASSVKRALWLLLVLASAIMMGCHIFDRIVYFTNFPTSVNVNINFNRSLVYPSFTICNQNSFRATKATELRRYRVLEAMFSSSTPTPFNMSLLSGYNMSDVKLDDLFLSTAHSKYDFIIDCTWRKTRCGPDNFTRVLTDHGVCFTFSPGHSPLPHLPGSEHGLKLILNVEQYEYMPGPEDAAGIKMLLHDHKDLPKVSELGYAIPTGAHAIVGIQLFLIEKLPYPRGQCDSLPSPYYEHYTRDNCHMACLTRYLAKVCGCRHHYMPHFQGVPPVCSIRQYYDCYLQASDRFRREVLQNCYCPIPCSYFILKPTFSYSSISSFASNRLLVLAAHGTNLSSEYMAAVDTTHRMEWHKAQDTRILVLQTQSALQTMISVLQHEVRNTLLGMESAVRNVSERLQKTWALKNHLYLWQEHNIIRNFMRVRDSMNERTFQALALGYTEFASVTELRIRFLMDKNVTSKKERQTTYLILKSSLTAKLDLAHRALANYTQLVSIYEQGIPIFPYTYLNETVEDNKLIVPKPLFHRALLRPALVLNVSDDLGQAIVNLRSAVRHLADIAWAAYTGNGTANTDQVTSATATYNKRSREFYHNKSIFDSEVIDYPQKVIKQRITKFQKLWQLLDHTVKDRLNNIANLKLSLDVVESSVLNVLNSSMTIAERYIRGDDVTKLDVARELTSQKMDVAKASLEVFFNSLRLRNNAIEDGWSELAEIANEIWEKILVDEDMAELYEYRNYTSFQRNLSEVVAELSDEFEQYRQRFDLQRSLGSVDNVFLRALKKLMTYMKKYLQKNIIGNDFVQENIVQLEIYFKENYFHQSTQQIAYDTVAFLCDVGGSMGLFVGASVLSIGELIDLCLHQSFYHLRYRIKH